MKNHAILVATLCVIAGGPAITRSETVSACPAEGPDGPGQLHESWILEGWDRQPDDPPFVFAKKLGRYYDLEGEGVFYDDLAPGFKTAYRADEYGALWEGPFNEMRSAAHAVSDGPHAVVGNRVASTTLEFVARLEAQDGTVTAIRDRSQLGWECHGGRWVIRHEHNSAREVAESEISLFLQGGEQSGVSKMQNHPYTGMWVTEDGRIRQELKPDGLYAEARGDRENAYTGRYEVEGDSIQYWDDSGFAADGKFINGALYHGGMVMRREGVEQ